MSLKISIVLILFLSFNVNAQRLVKNIITDYDASSSMVSYVSNTGEIIEAEVNFDYVRNGLHIVQLFDTSTGEKYYSIKTDGTLIKQYPTDTSAEIEEFNSNVPNSPNIVTIINKCNGLVKDQLKLEYSFKPLKYDITIYPEVDGRKKYKVAIRYVAKNSYGAEVEGYKNYNLKI